MSKRSSRGRPQQPQLRRQRELTDDQVFFQTMGQIFDRASNARTMAKGAMELAKDPTQREFFVNAVTELEGVMVTCSQAILKPILESLAKEKAEAAGIVLPT